MSHTLNGDMNGDMKPDMKMTLGDPIWRVDAGIPIGSRVRILAGT